MKARTGVRRFLGLFCVLTGAALVTYAASVTAGGFAWQHRTTSLFTHDGYQGPKESARPAATMTAALPQRGDPLARMRIERLGLDIIVAEGSDARTLSRAPGHMIGSALPGEADNCIVAGHRDGPFGLLRYIRPGDVVNLDGHAGATRYRVDTIEIVDRHDPALLAPTDDPILTLVTCYPFRYVGKAPKRFVVRASLLDSI